MILYFSETISIFCKSSKLKRIIESLRDWGRDCWCETGCDNTCKKRYGWALGELPEGYDHKYTYSNLGYNLKITDMQAAIGVSQFKRLEEFIRARRNNFFLLRNKLSDLQEYFILPTETKKSFPSWFGFPLTIKNSKKINRNNLVKYLNNYNIGTRLMFAGNIIKQPYLKDLNYRIVGNLKNSDKIMNDSFWVGIYPGLKKSNINYISKILHQYIASL